MKPTKILMQATRPLRYGTRHLVAGDYFECRRGHARVLAAAKRATEVPGNRMPASIPPIPAALKSRAMAGKMPARAARDPDGNVPDDTNQPENMTALRQEYRAKVGRRPFGSWDADELRRRMAEAEGE